MFRQSLNNYAKFDSEDLGSKQLSQLRDELKSVEANEISSSEDGKAYIELLQKLRKAIAENDKLHGDNYPDLLNSILSVGENGLYSNNLRFVFELIQNVDDCDYANPEDCNLDIHFDFNNNRITLTYNEVGFTPFNVFAITGIAEAAKNLSVEKNEIGEKGIGFKSVFGVAERVWIRSGWFSFELYKDNFTIPVPRYENDRFHEGTCMVLYVPKKVQNIYKQIRDQYCKKNAIFSSNPILFLNKLTKLKLYNDYWHSMEFKVSGHPQKEFTGTQIEKHISVSVDLSDHDSSKGDIKEKNQIICTRYSLLVPYSREACVSRYGADTIIGKNNNKKMLLQVLVPEKEYVQGLGCGALYSFLPTQLKLSVPMVCHVPFKLDASREFVDPQDNNLWFEESTNHLIKLLDEVYLDLRNTATQDIVFYIPDKGKSLFADNNGKEKCLSNNNSFLGNHYLQLPLFCAVDDVYHKAEDIFCFRHDEMIDEPERLYKLLATSKILFLMPKLKNAGAYGIETFSDAYYQLFVKALSNTNITEDALSLLKCSGFNFSEGVDKALSGNANYCFSIEQIESFAKYEDLWSSLTNYSCKRIKENMRPAFRFEGSENVGLSNILYDEFSVDDTPRSVEKYLKYCNEGYICADIGNDNFFPCYNGIVLSKSNPLSSITAFCFALDKNNTFSIRMKLREFSDHLNIITADDSLESPDDYLRKLRNIRKLVKESLGKEGYKRYIDLILRSGTDKNRFIQELIQNADDCYYAPDVIPTFTLKQQGKTIITEYNELGFTRENIRSITAIGESTKNSLIDQDFQTIGKKGVGFKTIFSIASKVCISSGDYHFALTDNEPTIPIPSNKLRDNVNGTRMVISLKGKNILTLSDNKDLLKLCLCLRHLKRLNIGEHIVHIEDTDNLRVISIDNKSYKFRKLIHSFTLPDSVVEEQSRTEYRQITPQQEIVCYISERKSDNGYIYNGLPTRHKMNVPISVDAPFELTTSREQIEEDKDVWNDYIRNEFYKAIIDVMISLRDSERIDILKYIRYVLRLYGSERRYVNDISDSEYIKSFDPVHLIKQQELLPTYNSSFYALPSTKEIHRYPPIAHFLFNNGDFGSIRPESIIDESTDDYENVFNALGCTDAGFEIVFELIEEYAETYIKNSEFAELLFDYLQNASDEYLERIATLRIIPVYTLEYGHTQYLSFEEIHDELYVKKGAFVSDLNYYVLNEKVLSKPVCEKILGININEMNSKFERARYQDYLKKYLRNITDVERIYLYLLSEFNNGNLEDYNAFDILKANIELVPLKNQLGEITDDELFICNQPEGYFYVDMIKRISISDECKNLALQIGCSKLENIHYENLRWSEQLTEDDIECLTDDYFVYSEELLRGFYRDGFISNELWHRNNLEYLVIGKNFDSDGYEFPEEPVLNINRLKLSVKKQFDNPTRIVSVNRTVSVYVGEKSNGEQFELQVADAREGVMRKYNPDNNKEICFCQMCKRLKPYNRIEVNNILIQPKYFFKQLRLSLCLECSKDFEAYRHNENKRNDFVERLKRADVSGGGTVEVALDDTNSITFTAVHLAEIQEILKSDLF